MLLVLRKKRQNNNNKASTQQFTHNLRDYFDSFAAYVFKHSIDVRLDIVMMLHVTLCRVFTSHSTHI